MFLTHVFIAYCIAYWIAYCIAYFIAYCIAYWIASWIAYIVFLLGQVMPFPPPLHSPPPAAPASPSPGETGGNQAGSGLVPTPTVIHPVRN